MKRESIIGRNAGWVLGVLLFAAAIGFYGRSVEYGLVGIDDEDYVTQNGMVLPGLTGKGVWDAFSDFHSGLYIPLVWVSYMADVTVWRATAARPWGFHATNVLLHAANAVLFYWLLLKLLHLGAGGKRRKGDTGGAGAAWAFLLALLWAAHPLRVESVAWVTERKDVLSLFFAMLSLHGHLRAAEGRRRTWAWAGLSLGAYAAALLAKPSLVPFPLLLAVVDVLVLGKKPGWRWGMRLLPVFLLAGAAGAATLWGHHGLAEPVGWWVRLAHLPQTLGYYLRATVWPRHLTLLEPDPIFGTWSGVVWGLWLAGMLWGAWRCRRSSPAVALGVGWFFLFLLPVSGLTPLPNAVVCDRFSYVPAMGLSVMLLPLAAGLGTPTARRWAALALALAAVSCMALTWRLLPAWRTTDTLYARVRRFNPGHRFLARYDYTRAVMERGDYWTARQIAVNVLSEHLADPGFNLFYGVALANTEGPEEGYAFLSERNPGHGEAVGEWAWEMATLALWLGRPEEAMSYAEMAEAHFPKHSRVRENVARLRKAAQATDPADALPYYVSQWMLGERQDAYEFFGRLVAAYPERPDILANVAWFLATADWSPAPAAEALDLAGRALRLAGERPPPELLDTYAAAAANAGDFDGAVAAEERALELLGKGAESRGDYEARLGLYRRGMPYRKDIRVD